MIRHPRTLPKQPTNTIAIHFKYETANGGSFNPPQRRCKASKCCIICWLIVVYRCQHALPYLESCTRTSALPLAARHTNDTHLSYRHSMQIFFGRTCSISIAADRPGRPHNMQTLDRFIRYDWTEVENDARTEHTHEFTMYALVVAAFRRCHRRTFSLVGYSWWFSCSCCGCCRRQIQCTDKIRNDCYATAAVDNIPSRMNGLDLARLPAENYYHN